MATKQRELAPIRLELVIVIVEKSKTAFYTDLFQSYGSNLQLITNAKGTADASILQLLGLGEYEQSAIIAAVRSDTLDEIMDALEKRFHTIRNGKGIAMAVPFSSMIGKTMFGFLTGNERVANNG